MNVTVLGAGSWGTTVASLSAARKPTILWARNAEVAQQIDAEHVNESYLSGFKLNRKLRATADLEEAVTGCDLLVVGVPTGGFRGAVEEASKHLRPWVPVVSLSKGLERGTLLRMTEVIKEVLPGHPAAALTGPNIAKEIMAGQAAASVIATEDLTVAAAIQDVLHRGLFRIYLNHDVIGCEMGGALKNVVAIASGVGQGIGVGDNTRAMVITRGLAEITRLGVEMGAEATTFAGLAGMGDLIATCMSPHSRNRQVGEQLGKGRALQEILDEMNMVAEGVKTSKAVVDIAASIGLELPIAFAVASVLYDGWTVDDALASLLARATGHELEGM